VASDAPSDPRRECATHGAALEAVLELTGPSTSSTFSRIDVQTGECVAVDLSNAGTTIPYVVGAALDPEDVFPSLERTIRN